MSSETSFPEFINTSISEASLEPLFNSFLNKSPVESWKKLKLLIKKEDWVPLPAPGGPKITIFITLRI